MKIPLLSRRTEPATNDDHHDDRSPTGNADRPTVTDRPDAQTTYRSGADDNTPAAEHRAAERAAVARAATNRPVDDDTRRDDLPATERDGRADQATTTTLTDHDRTVHHDRTADHDGDGVPDRPVVAGPKPRASLLATLGLIVGVVGVLFVLTGTLAGYGIAIGAVGAVLAVVGLLATRRRHVAGKTDALLGIAAGLGAVVLGVLAMTGQFDWPSTDGDWVARLREWLDSQFVDRL
ncbi:hypothetical protein GA0070616_1597 [Micromonospora nigra]|uniref:Thrombospondin n=1 Tax=Micromonospora nigra TaxID=145857 RepID=A0A1C6RP66_9ACTN|nr:thrombospondin [Micromonospora nigra]SCL18811.1 hypothetical protein GA0070616_1597 [Micromonospora nigra]